MAARRAAGRGLFGDSPARWTRRAHTVGPRQQTGRRLAVALMVVTVILQVLVWGRAPATGRGGALLPQLRPEIGVAYAVAVVALELLLCAWARLRHGVATVLVTTATVDACLWGLRLGGLHVPSGAAASLTAAFGALALAGGFLTGRLEANTRR